MESIKTGYRILGLMELMKRLKMMKERKVNLLFQKKNLQS